MVARPISSIHCSCPKGTREAIDGFLKYFSINRDIRRSELTDFYKAMPEQPRLSASLRRRRPYSTNHIRSADSLPKAIFNELAALASNDADLRQRIETMIDGGLGSCALHDPVVAAVVEDALHHFDGARYRLIAWVIMPNHVHVLVEQIGGTPLGDIVHAWKSFTAKQANRQLGRTGPFWAPDYFDRFIRDQAHFDVAVHYIHENPVKAGLVARAEEWQWSSAWRGDAGTAGVPPASPTLPSPASGGG